MISPSLFTALDHLQTSWKTEDKFKITSDLLDVNWHPDNPLRSELSRLRDGRTCSLPYYSGENINWLTFGGTQEELHETIEDLRCWILPYLGNEDTIAIVTCMTAKTDDERAFCSISGWYFRWHCPKDKFKTIATRLNYLSELLKSRSTKSIKTTPSLNSLRLDFVASLRTGEWEAAKKSVDLIDLWQLDSAKNTLLMRLRTHYEEGAYDTLIDTINHNEILDGELPFRLREMVIEVIYKTTILPIEESLGWHEAFNQYQKSWQKKLASYVIAQRSSTPFFPLSAYQAYFEQDYETLSMLFEMHSLKVAGEMLLQLPKKTAVPVINIDLNPVIATVIGAQPSIAYSFWTEIGLAVRNGSQTTSRACINNLPDSVLDDPEWISIGAETLIDIFTDPLVLDKTNCMLVAEEVLLAIIDAVVNSKAFPRHEHSVMYESLIATWVIARNDSSSEQDGQLLLGLVGAAIEVSATSVTDCESAIRTWWCKRKIISRLPWLIAAIEMLVLNHPKTSSLQDLWIDGADLISRLEISLSKAERNLWQKIGFFVEIDKESIYKMIAEPSEDELGVEVDLLKSMHLNKVAVVTLHERAGKQAAEELKSRTGAEIVIVTSTSAGELTKTAESADLILFVWAACTHAVYRSFDHVRDKLQYVQGTGPSSIILAAERWATLQKLN